MGYIYKIKLNIWWYSTKKFYEGIAQLEEQLTFNRVVRGSSPRGRTSQEQCPRLNCIGLEWLNKSFLSVVRNAFI